MNRTKGFTLIELIIVIAIIAILALILIPQVTNYINDANDNRDKANAKICYTTAFAVWTSAQTNIDTGVVFSEGCLIYTSDDGSGTGVDGQSYAPTSSTSVPGSARYGDWIYSAATNDFIAGS